MYERDRMVNEAMASMKAELEQGTGLKSECVFVSNVSAGMLSSHIGLHYKHRSRQVSHALLLHR